MAPLDDTRPATRFDSFNVYKTSYKKIGEHEIGVAVLVPKDLKPGKHPVMVKFHGGGLVTGDALYADWISAFFVPLIHRTCSIVVLPNYRLIPEHTGADILQDLADFWTWFHSGGVDAFLSSQHALGADKEGSSNSLISLDYTKILASGDSAGGYMALMSGLTQPRGTIKALLAQYPMTNYLRAEPADSFFGFPPPPESVIAEHMATVEPGVVVSSATPPARSPLSLALALYGQYLKYFGDDEKMWPVGLVGEKESLPPTWIVHGGADSLVSVEDCRAFVDKCKGLKDGEVKLVVREGEDHGFDAEVKEDEAEWLKEGLRWVEKKWLS
ncbi:alpha/beta-hydrolase [Stemphylium lycopersici]|nr:alpha/beta-hydrolase [Stemphylium lycopersici]